MTRWEQWEWTHGNFLLTPYMLYLENVSWALVSAHFVAHCRTLLKDRETVKKYWTTTEDLPFATWEELLKIAKFCYLF